MTEPSNPEEKPGEDLRTRLHAMESKVRKLRDMRNMHNDEAKRLADKRNTIQSQYKEHREKLDVELASVRALRAEIKALKEKRNAIQSQIRDLIGTSKKQREGTNDGKSASHEYHKLISEVSSLENVFETRGGMSPKKEKETMESIKRMRRRIQELEPEVRKLELVKVDLSDRDGAIKTLKLEADAAHQSMLDVVKTANEASEELDELFSHRDFLKSEGDRFHNEYVAAKEKANEIHAKIVEMMDQVNEVRDKLKLAREERESWMTDHNDSVTKEMKTGADSDEVADTLLNTLLNSGNLTFGGTMSSDRSGRATSKRKTSGKKSQMRKVDMSAARSRK